MRGKNKRNHSPKRRGGMKKSPRRSAARGRTVRGAKNGDKSFFTGGRQF